MQKKKSKSKIYVNKNVAVKLTFCQKLALVIKCTDSNIFISNISV